MHLPGVEVHAQGPDLQDRRPVVPRRLPPRLASGATQEDPDPRHELAGAERLREVVVRAHRQADERVDLLAAGREHEDVAVGERPQPAAHLDAVQAGQPEVEDDDVGVDRAHHVDGLRPVVHEPYREPVPLEVPRDEAREGDLVVDDDGAAGGGRVRAAHGPILADRERRGTGPRWS